MSKNTIPHFMTDSEVQSKVRKSMDRSQSRNEARENKRTVNMTRIAVGSLAVGAALVAGVPEKAAEGVDAAARALMGNANQIERVDPLTPEQKQAQETIQQNKMSQIAAEHRR